jgi:hypothetical protein
MGCRSLCRVAQRWRRLASLKIPSLIDNASVFALFPTESALIGVLSIGACMGSAMRSILALRLTMLVSQTLWTPPLGDEGESKVTRNRQFRPGSDFVHRHWCNWRGWIGFLDPLFGLEGKVAVLLVWSTVWTWWPQVERRLPRCWRRVAMAIGGSL